MLSGGWRLLCVVMCWLLVYCLVHGVGWSVCVVCRCAVRVARRLLFVVCRLLSIVRCLLCAVLFVVCDMLFCCLSGVARCSLLVVRRVFACCLWLRVCVRELLLVVVERCCCFCSWQLDIDCCLLSVVRCVLVVVRCVLFVVYCAGVCRSLLLVVGGCCVLCGACCLVLIVVCCSLC